MADGWTETYVDGVDRAGDRTLLGLERQGPGRASFELTQPLARFDGKLFGGTAIAVAVALAEAETERPAIWTTVQFVSGESAVGDRLDCATEVLAMGASVAQVRITARVGDREIFCAVGATARPKSGRLEQTFVSFPAVVAPEDARPFELPMPDRLRRIASKQKRTMELRSAPPVDRAAHADDPLRIWARVPGLSATPAVQAYLADVVPLSIARAAGRAGGGTSIDNTLRFGPAQSTEWVLLELHPHQASGGYGHGVVHLWSPDGHLLGTTSQTTSLLLFD